MVGGKNNLENRIRGRQQSEGLNCCRSQDLKKK